MDIVNISPNNHKYVEKTKKVKILCNSFALMMTSLQKQLHNNYLFGFKFLHSILFLFGK